jgi:hypothetical protein
VGLKKIHHCSGKLCIAFRDQDENLDSTPRVHLNNNAGKLGRLMVATRKYGGKYDMEPNSKEGRHWFD